MSLLRPPIRVCGFGGGGGIRLFFWGLGGLRSSSSFEELNESLCYLLTYMQVTITNLDAPLELEASDFPFAPERGSHKVGGRMGMCRVGWDGWMDGPRSMEHVHTHTFLALLITHDVRDQTTNMIGGADARGVHRRVGLPHGGLQGLLRARPRYALHIFFCLLYVCTLKYVTI